MPYLGTRSAVDLLQNLVGLDYQRLMAFQNKNGLNPVSIVQQLAAAFGGANEYLFNRWEGVFYQTTSDHVMYRRGDGTSRKTPKRTEFTRADPSRGSVSGHMLPISEFEDGLAWTQHYLKNASQAEVDADIQEQVDAFINRMDYDMLTRIFSPVETPEGAGYSVPWAIGSGVTVPFVPPQWGSTTFVDTHTHFLFQSGTTAANVQTLLTNQIKELRHHGFSGRLVAFVSFADLDTYVSMSKFVALQPPGTQIVPGNGATAVQIISGETEGVPGEVFGYFNSATMGLVELRYLERIPSGYVFMTKSFGANNPKNGVALRIDPDMTFGLSPILQMTSTHPARVETILTEGMHGIGINQRLNGVVGQFAASGSSYTAPVIV